MRKITPHLWYDKEAKEAAELYCSIFHDSQINNVNTIHDIPSPTGDSDIVTFTLSGHPFMAISAGPLFKFNPSISFIVNFDPSSDSNARKNLDTAWNKLAQGGTILMPLDKYPFSEHYGWIQDKYGLSWQLILSNPGGEERPSIVPALMFVKDVCGKTEEASGYYQSVFENSMQGTVFRYSRDQAPEKEGNIMFTDFMINGQWFAAMDSAREHNFSFNEAVSFLVPCENQEEIDYFWEKLSADPNAEQCGWCRDKYGLSWQVWPTAMGEMMQSGSPDQVQRLTKAFLAMKKFDIAELERAFKG